MRDLNWGPVFFNMRGCNVFENTVAFDISDAQNHFIFFNEVVEDISSLF